MKALVIGGDGFIGRALVDALVTKGHNTIATTRRPDSSAGRPFLDLSKPVTDLPEGEVVYLVAAYNGFEACEGNRLAYRVNVDSTIEISLMATRRGSFPVFISSDAVEFAGSTAYARHKVAGELAVRILDGAIVRPSRVTQARVGNLCELLVSIGEGRKAGLHLWK